MLFSNMDFDFAHFAHFNFSHFENCGKRVRIAVILVRIFPGFSRIQTKYGEKYSVSFRIQSGCGKIREKCGPK